MKISINGFNLNVNYNPSFSGDIADTIHIEFTGDKGDSNPISETGYRSVFLNGTPQEYGITDNNLEEKLLELANKIADEEIILRKKKKRYEPKKTTNTTN